MDYLKWLLEGFKRVGIILWKLHIFIIAISIFSIIGASAEDNINTVKIVVMCITGFIAFTNIIYLYIKNLLL